MAHQKNSGRKYRDISIVFGVFLLVLVPLGIIVRLRTLRDESQSSQLMASSPVTTNAKNALWPEGSVVEIALSPSGKYLAGLSNGRMIIWDTSTRKALVGLPISSEARGSIQWFGDSLITNFGDAAEAWNWKTGQLLSAPIDPLGEKHHSDESAQYAQIDPVRDIKTNTRFSDKIFAAYKASTGQPYPLKTPGPLKLHDGHWLLLPGPAKGPLTLISSSDGEPNKPIPTPAPTPTPSAETKKLQAARTELLDELADLNDELREGQNLSAEERSQLREKISRTQMRLQSEDERLRALLPRTTSSQPLYFGTVMSWDGKTGKVLWRRKFQVSVFAPTLSASPDNKVVAVVGTVHPPKGQPFNEESNGIEFLDIKTGRSLSSVKATDQFNMENNMLWLPGHVLAVPDFDNGSLLRLFDAHTGKNIKSWPLEALAIDQKKSFQNAPRAWACDLSGTRWVFASPQEGWKMWSPAQIEMAIKRYKQAKSTR